MTSSTLGKLITLIEKSSGAYSIQSLAREMNVTPERIESMLDYWIRKGKIISSTNSTECGSCSTQEDCPFIVEMPRTYELVREEGDQIIELVHPACK